MRPFGNPTTTRGSQNATRRSVESCRPKIMFVFAMAFTIAAAATLYRVDHHLGSAPAGILASGLLLLWPVFVAEAAWGVIRRCRKKPLCPVLVRAALVALFPPLRAGLPDPRTGLVWLPWRGWVAPGTKFIELIERVLTLPTLVVASLSLPILVLDFLARGQTQADPSLIVTIRSASAVVWTAFTAEFVLKVWATASPISFAANRWADVLVIAVPILLCGVTSSESVAALFSAIRLGEGQLGPRGQLASLQGMAIKAWGALLVVCMFLCWRRRRRELRVRTSWRQVRCPRFGRGRQKLRPRGRSPISTA